MLSFRRTPEPSDVIHRARRRVPAFAGMTDGTFSSPQVSKRTGIVVLLGPAPVSVDELIRLSGLGPAVVQTVLLELELAARLERHAGGKVSLS